MGSAALIAAAILGIIIVIGGICFFGYSQRRKHLCEKYGDPQIAERILKGVIWQGETQVQLIESLGKPLDIDQKVLKTKVKEVWKFRRSARNRFGLKVTLDDGVVVGWEVND